MIRVAMICIVGVVVGAWTGTSSGQIVCNTYGTLDSAGGTLLMCPAGDGPTLGDIGAEISIHVHNRDGVPLAGVPAEYIWAIGGTDNIVLCGGYASSNADEDTDENGNTTMSGPIAAGGHDDQIIMVIESSILAAEGYEGGTYCSPIVYADVALRSPDMNGDLSVDNLDFTAFANAYESSEGDPEYDPAADLNNDGRINNVDFSLFGNHWQHACGM